MHFHYQKLDHFGEGRCWWHFSDNKTIGLSWHFFTHFCHLRFSIGDTGWNFSFALWPVAIWLHLEGFNLPEGKRKCIATWDNNREFWLTDEREFQLAIHHWTIWITPWGRENEWRSSDPWWIKGVTLNIPDFFLGRHRYTKESGPPHPILIPLPERSYAGSYTIDTQTWKRPLWFKKTRVSAWVTMFESMPFPGKGESAWNCGEDGLCGFGCSSTKEEDIIAAGVQSVMESRRRYGGSVYWRPQEKELV